MYLTDEQMDDQDRRMNCDHRNVSRVQVTNETVLDVCDDCGIGLGEPYRP